MDLTKVKEMLNGLVNDSMSTEDIEKIGAINQEIDNAEKEYADFITKHEDLRKKYIHAIQDTSFSEKPKDVEQQPKSLEECIQEEIKKR